MKFNKYEIGEASTVLKKLPDKTFHCCVTSPPYWGLRSYFLNGVILKKDAPKWVIEELEKLNIFPVGDTED